MQTPFTHQFLLVVIAIGFGATNSGSQLSAHEWQWKLKVGDKFDVTLNHSTVSDTVVGAYNAKLTSRYKLATSWVVKTVDDQQVATIEKSIKSIQFLIDSKAPVPVAINVDTATGTATGETISGTEGTTILKHLQSLVGKTLQVEMKPNGETNALPIPTATQTAIDAFPTTDYVMQMFHIGATADSETAYFVIMPAEIPKPSGSWQHHSDKEVHQGEAFVTIFKYVGQTKSDGVALDEFATTVQPKQAGDRKLLPGEPHPMTVSKQTGAGSCFFDRTKGNFTSAAYRSEIVTSSEAQRSVITSEYSTTVIRK